MVGTRIVCAAVWFVMAERVLDRMIVIAAVLLLVSKDSGGVVCLVLFMTLMVSTLLPMRGTMV